MKTFRQSPQDPDFVQNPYAAYARARSEGPVLYWEDYNMLAAFDAATVQALLRDRRLGREIPADQRQPVPAHLADFHAVDQHSMLELEPPTHTRLRGLVLRAFTSRRIAGLAPEIEAVAAQLLADLPQGPFDLIPAFCTQLPVRIIARLLGVPEAMWPDLLRWSNAMVAIYQVGRTRAVEDAANQAAADFSDFLRGYVDQRRHDPRDDLITQLIAAEEAGEKLSTDALIGTCILLLNAGHEATVHALGNGVACALTHQTPLAAFQTDTIAATTEEILRYDPPLHVFERFAYEDINLGGIPLEKGKKIALVLGAAGRDPAVYPDPDRVDPARPVKPHAAFGGGLHFCVGAPLARLEMQIGLRALFDHAPQLRLTEPPRYADSYHFHKLERLMVEI
ncbi:cytochrome P450 [uncultured Sulfitobacter sp.]|uniref:cytochrome P450 n=1 Tax=Sulfitobacter sp. SH22 TaxID=3421172 RepID=UPI0025E4C324|nr:cytochrome P450 [uncultured Sulfitobacter sp.]